MLILFFETEGIENELHTADDEIDADENAQSEGQHKGMEQGVDADEDIENAKEEHAEPAFLFGLLGFDGSVDGHSPLKDEPYGHEVDEEAVGECQKAGDGHQQDAENGGEDGKDQIEIEFLIAKAVDGADDTEDQKQDGEEIAGFEEGGHGSAGHGNAEKRHDGTENDQ